MSDSRILRMAELKRLKEDAQLRVEQLSELRAIVQEHANRNPEMSERVWLLQVIDNRRALMLGKIEQFDKGMIIEHENQQPELGALFIDGRKV